MPAQRTTSRRVVEAVPKTKMTSEVKSDAADRPLTAALVTRLVKARIREIDGTS